MTHDVKLGNTPLVVTTDKDAADRIAAAIEAEREHLFQCDGVKVSVVASDRGGPRVPSDAVSKIHGLKLADVIAAVDAADTAESVQRILDAENANPRSAGPRPSIVKRAQKRLDEEFTNGGAGKAPE